MTDNTQVFDESTPAPTETKTESTLPAELTDLVGEGKKYADVDTALKSVPAAQAHISKLEKELEDMKTAQAQLEVDLKARQSVEEALKSVGSQGKPDTTPAQQDQVQGVKPENLEGSIQAILDKNAKAAAAKQNVETVREALSKTFGDKAKEAFESKARELGLPVAELNRISAQSPQAALKLFGEVKTPTATARSTVNTEAIKPVKLPANKADRQALFRESVARVNKKYEV